MDELGTVESIADLVTWLVSLEGNTFKSGQGLILAQLDGGELALLENGPINRFSTPAGMRLPNNISAKLKNLWRRNGYGRYIGAILPSVLLDELCRQDPLLQLYVDSARAGLVEARIRAEQATLDNKWNAIKTLANSLLLMVLISSEELDLNELDLTTIEALAKGQANKSVKKAN